MGSCARTCATVFEPPHSTPWCIANILYLYWISSKLFQSFTKINYVGIHMTRTATVSKLDKCLLFVKNKCVLYVSIRHIAKRSNLQGCMWNKRPRITGVWKATTFFRLNVSTGGTSNNDTAIFFYINKNVWLHDLCSTFIRK